MSRVFNVTWKRLIVLVLFAAFWTWLLLQRMQCQELDTTITDVPDSTVGILEDNYKGTVLKQYFKTEENSKLEFVSLQFATYGDSIDTDGMVFSCYTGDGMPVWSCEIEKENLSDNSYYAINIDSNIKSESGSYYFTLEGRDEPDSGKATVALWCTDSGNAEDELYIDDELQDISINASYRYSVESYSLFYYLAVEIALAVVLFVLNIKGITENKKVSLVINILVFFANFVLVEWMTEKLGLPGLDITWQIKCMTYVFMLCVQMIFFGLMGANVYLSIIFTDILFVVFSLVNYFVMVYRGVPVIPSDLTAINTLSTVVGSYTIIFTLQQWIILAGVLLWVQFLIRLMINEKYHLRWKKEKRVILKKTAGMLLSAVTGVVALIWLCNPDVLERSGIITYVWNRNEGYYQNGPFINFMANVQYARIQKPKNYSRELAESYLKEYESEKEKTSDGEQPNIIIIMNESLADFDSYGTSDVTFSEDPLPFIHSQEENTKKGNCYVSIFGSGTSNSEMEALTGNSMAFFPSGSIVYQQFAKEHISGLAGSLKKNGYTNIAIHPCARTNWNRESVYQAMGFDAFYAEESFESAEIVRWVSDKATYEKIIDLYENKGNDEKLFVFDVTMQGHGGYDTNTDWENPVTVEQGDYPLANEYLSSTYVSDQAFEYLVEYFSEQEEPTLIFMFGDHQPAVETEFYETLLGRSLTDLGLSDIQRRYVIPYILWTNYDLKDSGEEDISANQIELVVKQNAGIALNSYDKFIREFSKKIPVINANGYQDKDGNWHELDEENEYQELIEKYNIIQYGIYCDGVELK